MARHYDTDLALPKLAISINAHKLNLAFALRYHVKLIERKKLATN